MVYMLISNVSTWTLKLSFFNRFFIFFSLFLLVYFVYSLFLIKIVLFRFKKLSFIIKILNLIGRSNIWVRCCLNQGRILVKSLSKRGSPPKLLSWNAFHTSKTSSKTGPALRKNAATYVVSFTSRIHPKHPGLTLNFRIWYKRANKEFQRRLNIEISCWNLAVDYSAWWLKKDFCYAASRAILNDISDVDVWYAGFHVWSLWGISTKNKSKLDSISM